jgi:hypothetical protein
VPVVAREQVDVVVAGADRPELVAGELRQPALRRELGVLDRLEHRVVDGPLVAPPHPERDPRDDLVHEPRHVGPHVPHAQVGADGLVAAADVEADAGRRDVVRVGDHAADRLGVADVGVGAQRARDRVAGPRAAAQLGDGALLDGAAHRDGDLRGHGHDADGDRGGRPAESNRARVAPRGARDGLHPCARCPTLPVPMARAALSARCIRPGARGAGAKPYAVALRPASGSATTPEGA